MTTFLSQLALSIYTKYEGNFENVTVIFPNKRAGLFLCEELSKLTKQALWLPDIITLDEFITRQIGLRKIDELPLVIKLYKAYSEVCEQEESFDSFYHWGSMLLSDFDDIDKYMVRADDLLQNLVAYKDIEHEFQYLTEEQTAVIKQFWQCFKGEQYSLEQQKFLSVWECLLPAYNRFREMLFAEQICYSGMGQRYFAEHIGDYSIENDIIFAGFNALNLCEKHIFTYYKDLGKAFFYWDYDNYYLKNPYNEAGLYIRENIELFGNALPEDAFDNLTTVHKQLEYVAVPSNTGQAKLLSTMLNEQDKPEDTAIVLCDEELLIPVLNSIPTGVHKLNVTMGYPASKSSIAGLLLLLLDLQLYIKQEKAAIYFYFKPVNAILSHPLLQRLYADDCHTLIEDINKHNQVYIKQESLTKNPLFTQLFCKQQQGIVSYLMDIMDGQIARFKETETDFMLEKEILFTLYTGIRGIDNIFRESNIVPEDELYIHIIRKLIDEITIPFEGEPIEGLQLMGLMETRMLDFKNLIILSANEGILPKGGTSPSFIPYSLRSGFGLPTPEHQDALFAYYFYRLIQRAEKVKLLYCSKTSGLTTGEMSRFMYQLKYESNLPISERTLQNSIDKAEIEPIVVEKDNNIMETMTRFYNPNVKSSFSPSALNTYMECPLRFYFKYIAGVKEPEEISEELDARLLGTIMHDSCEEIYARFGTAPFNAEQLQALYKNDVLIKDTVKEVYQKIYESDVINLLDSGLNLLILDVIKKYIKQIFKYDEQFVPFSMISMEKQYYIELPVGDKRVRIGGAIDRVDSTGGVVRVIDYKTGGDDNIFKTVESLFDKDIEKRNKAAFQTMLYCLMYEQSTGYQGPITPCIYSAKKLFVKDYDCRLIDGKDAVTNFAQYKEEFTDKLTELIAEILNPSQAFTQTSIDKKCEYCTYRGICLKV
ncbi:MAG: PD-(D/E)XK nuclease family protein [Marinifilaceae bacterium]